MYVCYKNWYVRMFRNEPEYSGDVYEIVLNEEGWDRKYGKYKGCVRKEPVWYVVGIGCETIPSGSVHIWVPAQTFCVGAKYNSAPHKPRPHGCGQYE